MLNSKTTYSYFSDGLLYLPEASMDILMRAGVPSEIANWIRRGMMLTESQRRDDILTAVNVVMDALNRKLPTRTAH